MNLKERGFAVDTKLKDLRDYVQTIADEYGTRIAYKFFVDSEVASRTYNRLREDVFSLASYLVGAVGCLSVLVNAHAVRLHVFSCLFERLVVSMLI